MTQPCVTRPMKWAAVCMISAQAILTPMPAHSQACRRTLELPAHSRTATLSLSEVASCASTIVRVRERMGVTQAISERYASLDRLVRDTSSPTATRQARHKLSRTPGGEYQVLSSDSSPLSDSTLDRGRSTAISASLSLVQWAPSEEGGTHDTNHKKSQQKPVW